jgi:hypothetical protein
MFKCTVVYGPDSVQHESERPIRIADVRNNEDLRDELGYGDNVNLMIGGITMPDDALVPNESVVVIETAANKKATVELALA